MSATPADIARGTVDGVVVTSPTNPAVSAAIAAAHIDARNGADREITMYFDQPAHAQLLLDERFSYLAKAGPTHIGIEVEEALPLGDTLALSPAVPCFDVVDSSMDLTVRCRLRGYAHDMSTDRFALEVLE